MNILSKKFNDDVVIVAAVRTPICRAHSGFFKELLPEDLLSAALSGLIQRSRIEPKLIQDILVGSVLAPGGGATLARMAALHAGFPESVPVGTVNRQCASGLQAIASIAASIKAGEIDIGIGAGVESMSAYYGPIAMPTSISESVTANQCAKDCLESMGVTSENVAKEYKVSREDQDKFAFDSHKKAAAAQDSGRFAGEIIPVNGVSRDDGVRRDTTLEKLASLRAAFGGATTGGNASQVSDGASAVLLARRSTAKALGLPILGRIVRYNVVGVAPRVMGIGPAIAIPKLLKGVGNGALRVEDIDVFEVNEAFASQSLMVLRALRIPAEKLNPNGGAIALGHPLGCSGARLVTTLLHDMKNRKKQLGVVSLCIGTGMGAAALFVNESE